MEGLAVHPSSSVLGLASDSEAESACVTEVVLGGSFEVASEGLPGVAFVGTPEVGAFATVVSILAAHGERRGSHPYVQKVRESLGERARSHIRFDREAGCIQERGEERGEASTVGRSGRNGGMSAVLGLELGLGKEGFAG